MASSVSPQGAAATGLRRQACERCFNRKFKCDKILPTCSACLGCGAVCQDRSLRLDASEEGLSIRHSSVIQYIESLKRKIAESACVDGNAPAKRQKTSPETPTRMVRSPRDTCPSAREAMDEIAFLSHSAMAEPRSEARELPRNLSLYNMIMAALSLQGSDPSRAGEPKGMSCDVGLGSHEAPTLDRQTTAGHMKLYVDHVCMRFPYLQAETVMRDYEGQVGGSPASQSSTAEYFNTCLAIATGALLSPDASLLSPLIRGLHSAAVRTLPCILEEKNGLASIKYMLSLAIFAMYSPWGGSAWHLSGLTMQRCVFLGLDKECEAQEHKTIAYAERRRLFWSAYIIDRSSSMALGRPFSIRDEDIDVPVRLADLGHSPTEVESVFKHHVIGHARLASKILSEARGSLLCEYENICFWAEVPAALRNLPPTQQHLNDSLEQLKCNLLMMLMKFVVPEEVTVPAGLLPRVQSDVLDSCRRFICAAYNQVGNFNLWSSFVDSAQFFGAAVIVAYLSSHPSAGDPGEVLQKASLIVAVAGGRFSTTLPFHRAIMAILAKLTKNSSSSASRDSSHIKILDDLEMIIPEYIYQIVSPCLR